MSRLRPAILFCCFLSSAAFGAGDGNDTLVWPPPPERPRIRFVQAIASVADLDIHPGFFSRIAGLLFGSQRAGTWLVHPAGIGVSARGLIAVADPGIRGVHLIDRNEKEYRFISGTRFGAFSSPVGVAFARDGSMYVSDSETGKITVFDDDMDAAFVVEGRLRRPTGLAVRGDSLFVVDTGLHKIVVFDLKGGYVGEFGGRGAGEGEFNFPVQLSPSGPDLYIVDALNYRIVRADLSGAYRSSFGSQGDVAGRFASPKAIAGDSDGNLYVTDALMDNVQLFDTSGRLLLVVGRRGTAPGEFQSPSGIAVDGGNTIYVVDALNRRLQLFQYIP